MTPTAAQKKSNKTYPPPDTSKVYDSVPRTEKPRLSFVERMWSRINAEFCLIALEERERWALLAILVVLLGLFVGTGVYLFGK